MSLHRNGGNSVFICEATGDIIEEDFDPLANGRKSPFSAAFRGFHKVPTVLLSRIDIRPYLKSNGADINKEKIGNIVTKESTDADTSADNNERELLDELSMICKVGVLRDDLEKLKESLKNGTFVDNRLNMLKCKICEKKYQNERKLHNHQENKHMIIYKPEPTKSQKRVSFSDKVIVHELKEYHKCRKCSKIFEDYKSLKVHMKHWHKKRKCYICNYCSKKFIDRMFFKVHMKLHCDTCGLLLPNKKKFNEHKRNVCRILKYHECETCNSVFFKFMDLKDHSYDHTDPSYICDICKDQCPTICAIAHHIKFLHCKNRPTLLYTVISLGNERLYLCNFCDVSSVDRDFIENHTQLLPDLKNRVMTGYEDYYFCDHCFEKFATETDMLQHKWSHFLKTDDTLTKGILTNVHKAQTLKTIYRVGDQIPDSMQPKLVLEKIEIPDEELTEPDSPGNINSFEIEVHDINKPLVDPKSKKTLLSKHQCQVRMKYISFHTAVRLYYLLRGFWLLSCITAIGHFGTKTSRLKELYGILDSESLHLWLEQMPAQN